MPSLALPAVVEEWLSQFAQHDRPIARTLYESLSFATNTDFEVGIRRLLENVLAQTEAPIAVFAVRGLQHEKRTATHYLGALGDRDWQPVAMVAEDAGSEGRLAHLLTVVAGFATGSLLAHPTLNEMATAGCRTIVFVDDLVGSGKRMRTFARHFYDHPTIKSWVSLKYITAFKGLAFAATTAGLEHAQRTNVPHFSMQIYRAAPTLSDSVAAPEVSLFRNLCYLYAPRTSRPRIPLGFGNSGCLMVFAHACPNNAPAILWANQTGSWNAIFPERMIPEELLLGTGMRAAPIWPGGTTVDNMGDHTRTKAKATALILRESRRKRDPLTLHFRLSVITGLPIADLRSLLEICVATGLIDESGRTTDAGVVELSRLATLSRQSRRSLGAYFPKRLRPRRI